MLPPPGEIGDGDPHRAGLAAFKPDFDLLREGVRIEARDKIVT
jgi:hypothetical protein